MSPYESASPEDPGSRPDEVRSVLDASAVLALLDGEPGAEVVADAIAEGAALSTVNHAEVGTVLIRKGVDPDLLVAVAAQVLVEPFTVEDALAAARFSEDNAHLGLTLGDRSCLALAKRFGVPAITSDRIWARADVGVTVTLIR